MFKIKKFSTQEKAAENLGRDFSRKLKLIKKNKSRALLLFSGSSSFTLLKHIDNRVLGNHLTIGVLDERYDPSNQNNNFYQLSKTDFYRKARQMACEFIDTTVKKGQTQKQLADYFEKEIKKWRKNYADGVILATVGMGPDGHIAGMMPIAKQKFDKLFCGKKWIAAYNAFDKNPYPLRVTTTVNFVKSIDYIYSFICGPTKKKAFKEISRSGPINDLPARILKQTKNTIIYTTI